MGIADILRSLRLGNGDAFLRQYGSGNVLQVIDVDLKAILIFLQFAGRVKNSAGGRWHGDFLILLRPEDEFDFTFAILHREDVGGAIVGGRLVAADGAGDGNSLSHQGILDRRNVSHLVKSIGAGGRDRRSAGAGLHGMRRHLRGDRWGAGGCAKRRRRAFQADLRWGLHAHLQRTSLEVFQFSLHGNLGADFHRATVGEYFRSGVIPENDFDATGFLLHQRKAVGNVVLRGGNIFHNGAGDGDFAADLTCLKGSGGNRVVEGLECAGRRSGGRRGSGGLLTEGGGCKNPRSDEKDSNGNSTHGQSAPAGD